MLVNLEPCYCPKVRRYPQAQGNVLSMDNSKVVLGTFQFLKNSRASSFLAKQRAKISKAASIQKTRFMGWGDGSVGKASALQPQRPEFDL